MPEAARGAAGAVARQEQVPHTPSSSEQIMAVAAMLQHSDAQTVASAAKQLEAIQWSKDTAAAFRLSGHAQSLVRCLDSERGLPPAARISLAKVIGATATCDGSCKAVYFRAGLVRAVQGVVDGTDMALLGALLTCLLICIRDLDPQLARTTYQEMFRLGTVSALCSFLQPGHPQAETSARILGWISWISKFQERLRDLGMVPRMLRLADLDPNTPFYTINVMNMSESEALRIMMKEEKLVDIMERILSRTSNALVRTSALISLAHVYGDDAKSSDKAQSLLTSHDISHHVMMALDATVHGDGSYLDSKWSTLEVMKAINSLSRNSINATQLAKIGVVDIIVEVLQQYSVKWSGGTGADASVPATGGAAGAEGDAAEVVTCCCRACLNMASVPALRVSLQQAGLVEALRPYTTSGDLRVADSAKGTLLQLGQLDDMRAVNAAVNSDFAGDLALQQKYDVFLSHKRSDAKDFARALYNLLVLRGLTAFLDFEYREELTLEGGLAKLVRSCTNFVFVLTDNVLSSNYCIMELQAAVESNMNIILVVKDGSRWKDGGGQEYPFPPDDVVRTLPEAVRKVFGRKAVYHSDEYYQAFVDQLLKKLVSKKGASETTAMAARPSLMSAPEATPLTAMPPAAAARHSFISAPDMMHTASMAPAGAGTSFIAHSLLGELAPDMGSRRSSGLVGAHAYGPRAYLGSDTMGDSTPLPATAASRSFLQPLPHGPGDLPSLQLAARAAAASAGQASYLARPPEPPMAGSLYAGEINQLRQEVWLQQQQQQRASDSMAGQQMQQLLLSSMQQLSATQLSLQQEMSGLRQELRAMMQAIISMQSQQSAAPHHGGWQGPGRVRQRQAGSESSISSSQDDPLPVAGSLESNQPDRVLVSDGRPPSPPLSHLMLLPPTAGGNISSMLQAASGAAQQLVNRRPSDAAVARGSGTGPHHPEVGQARGSGAAAGGRRGRNQQSPLKGGGKVVLEPLSTLQGRAIV